MVQNTSNKRVNPRFACHLEGIVRPLERNHDAESFRDLRRDMPVVTACNLSREGLCILTSQALKPGEILRLELNADGTKEKVPCFGEVCWAEDGRAGVRILALTESGRAALARHMRGLTPQPDPTRTAKRAATASKIAKS